ncbi:CMRF35-like molecule 1 isoform X8 [Myotis daubentonii]|uniref:CMRF35-like molecule 1 isoform X8 n=1 Tax=Myotis daubentonii TaxID=98922 RepID=UPI0028735146|nr:CMRF35-like molecule 1 isoform X8 [Myotis daubentonii]
MDLCFPDSSYIISGPKEVRGGEWDSLSVQCHYDPGWETYRKWWCRGHDWISCEILVITNGSEMVKKNRVSIRDHPRSLMFTVIMKELRREDTDTYWCGIERTGSDHGVPVKVTIDPGSSVPITGPEAVRGLERGVLTVQCRYDTGWETYRKWWCRGAVWGSCKILVQTNESTFGVKERVSIRDNQTNHTFTVTMKELRREDTDTYWCGIERTGSDHGVPVKVTIDPVPVTPDDTIGFPNVTSQHSDGSGVSPNLFIILPLLFTVLLLLLVAASLLVWRMMKRQKKAAGISPEQVLQPPEDNVCYANLNLKQTGASPSSPRKRAPTQPSSSAQDDQGEVEYITMAPFLDKDICYAALSLDTSDQDSIYINRQDLITPPPSRNQEELIQYSAIRKP